MRSKLKPEIDGETLQRIIDSLDENLYITDPDTCEILFMNKKMKDDFGGKDLVGETCWKVLQKNGTEKCHFCPHEKIKENPNEHFIWERKSEITNRYYRNIDTMVEWKDKGMVHIQHSKDFTVIKQTEEELSQNLKRQILLSNLSIELSSDDPFKIKMSRSLELLAKYYHANRVILFEVDRASSNLLLHIQYCDGLEMLPNNYQVENFLTMNSGKYMPALLEDSDSIFGNFSSNCKTLSIPLFVNNTIEGFIFIDPYKGNELPHAEVENLKIISKVISAEIARVEYEHALMRHDQSLESAVKSAEKANKAKTDFLLRMSHELRSPLNGITGMSYLASKSNDMQKVKSYITKIESSTKHLLDLVNDILDMSRIESEKLELANEEFNLEKLLTEIVHINAMKLDEKHQTLSVNIAQNIHTTYIGDAIRLSQVISNLLNNSIKFSPKDSEIIFEVNLLEMKDNKTKLLFRMIDHGVGMSDETLANLFSPFVQGDGGISRKYGGSGLGLALSKKIVNMMGGEIWADSIEGVGSTFTFTVRLDNPPTMVPVTLDPSIDYKQLNVLVVDDSPETLVYFSDLFASHGIKVTTALSGEEAISIVEKTEKPFNLMFIDWRMPGLNGIQSAQIIQEKCHPNSVIILVSIAEWTVLEVEARKAGINRFLSKPLFADTILSVINDVMGFSGKNRELHASESQAFIGKKILLAEKYPGKSKDTQLAFAGLGITPIICSSYEQVFATLKDEQNISMIFADCEECCAELIGRVRDSDFPLASSIPMICFISSNQPQLIDECYNAGMSGFVQKPIDKINLRSILNKYLSTESQTKKNLEDFTFSTFLPYIDVKDGLSRIRQNISLYIKLLKSYLSNASFEPIQNTVVNKPDNIIDQRAALDAVHNIKGISANLSLFRVFELAKLLEQEIKNETDPTSTAFSLKKAMKITNEKIQELISELNQFVN